MKIPKILSLVLVLSLVGVVAAGCAKKTSTTTTTKTLTATVTKGNISESITGTGNLAYSNVETVAFDMTGNIEEVLVSAGDTVKKGQELAKLDTSDWETQLKALEKAVVTANSNLQTKENDLITAQRQVTAKELALSQAELDLQTAQDNLALIVNKMPATINQDQLAVANAQIALKTAQDKLVQAKANYDSNWTIPDYILNYAQAQAQLQVAQDNLAAAQKTLAADQAGPDSLQISQAQLKIKQSQQALDNAKSAVDDANSAVSDAQQSIEDAKQAVQDAQDALDTEKSLSPTIIAPIDGFVTKVNAVIGNNIQKGTAAVLIADPSQLAANIMVTENDIFSVKVGETATVSIDALSDLAYPAKITKIAPTATVSQGVVNYSVTVQLTSLQPIISSQSTSQLPPGTFPSGALPSGTLPSGVRPTGVFPTVTLPSGALPTTTTPATSSQAGTGTSRSIPTNSSSQSITLKDGLSATVEIISKQVTNVLIIPSKAITRKGQTYTVQVVNSTTTGTKTATNGTTTETKTITIGMTDGTNTEITSGLSEGDKVTYTVTSTSSSSSSNNSNRQQQIIPIGGPGGF